MIIGYGEQDRSCDIQEVLHVGFKRSITGLVLLTLIHSWTVRQSTQS